MDPAAEPFKAKTIRMGAIRRYEESDNYPVKIDNLKELLQRKAQGRMLEHFLNI